MKKTTKRAMLASGLLGVATVGVLTSGGFAYAKTGGQDASSGAATNKIATNRGSVQRGMKEQQLKHHKERLAQLVKDGKLTQAQADMLEAKHEEMEPRHKAIHKETDPAKRKAAREAMKAEMKQWAKDNGIDLNVIRPERSSKAEGRGPDGHMGMGRMMQGDRDDAPPAQ